MLIPQLTFTRFLAAISVVIVHYGFAAYPFKGDSSILFLSYLTSLVTYFFVLSGFILVVSNYKNGELSITIDKKKFWKNRFARIYPLYLFAIVFVLIEIHLGDAISNYFGWNKAVVYTILLFQSWIPDMALAVNFPAWSLSVEAFFYLLFPFLYHWLKPYVSWKMVAIVLTFWLVNIFLYAYFYENNSASIKYFYYFPPLHLISFIIGICGGFFYLDNIEDLKKYKIYILLASTTVLLFVLYSIYINAFFIKYFHNGMFAPLYLLIIYLVALDEGFVKKIFSLKPFIYLGEISYGIYLLQCPVVFLVSNKLGITNEMGATGKFYFELILLIIFSAICHELIEKPARKYLRG